MNERTAEAPFPDTCLTGRRHDMAPEPTSEEKRARGIALCRWQAARWRREAAHVREHATLPHLSPEARATLLRSAERSDDEAAYWEAGAREYDKQKEDEP